MVYIILGVRDLVWAIGAINGELAEQERIYGLCQLVLELLPDEAAAREMIKAGREGTA